MQRWQIIHDWHAQLEKSWGYRLSKFVTTALGETLHRIATTSWPDLRSLRTLINEVRVVGPDDRLADAGGSLPDGVYVALKARPAEGTYDVWIDEAPFKVGLTEAEGQAALRGALAIEFAKAVNKYVPLTREDELAAAEQSAAAYGSLADRDRDRRVKDVQRQACLWRFHDELTKFEDFRGQVAGRLKTQAQREQYLAAWKSRLLESKPLITETGSYLQFGKLWVDSHVSPILARSLDTVLTRINQKEPKDLAWLVKLVHRIENRVAILGHLGESQARFGHDDYTVRVAEDVLMASFNETSQSAALKGILAHEFGHVISLHGPRNEAELADDIAEFRRDPRATARRIDAQEATADYYVRRWGFEDSLEFVKRHRLVTMADVQKRAF